MLPPRAEPKDSLSPFRGSNPAAAPVEAVPAFPTPAWQHAVIRLANSTERLTAQLSELMGRPITSPPTLVEYRDLIENLINWMDQTEGLDPDLEDNADDEPTLGNHEIAPMGAVCYLPSELRCEFDLEGDQCEDEGVTA
ncbi:hypothetical protein IVB22_33120 [Bradyrhizobium sp. 190]|uniref:hypothetical protein n=1 Tax=Bradyrhizobium sp. 190 TaxID=2782658 RepID=UPI001FFB87B4|nr:hypothetical protein [Bradyrhizobium sp. 190]MCK1517262.1 hypothetical protein [Bradyrhizobium sp. 190]